MGSHPHTDTRTHTHTQPRPRVESPCAPPTPVHPLQSQAFSQHLLSGEGAIQRHQWPTLCYFYFQLGTEPWSKEMELCNRFQAAELWLKGHLRSGRRPGPERSPLTCGRPGRLGLGAGSEGQLWLQQGLKGSPGRWGGGEPGSRPAPPFCSHSQPFSPPFGVHSSLLPLIHGSHSVCACA